MLSLSVDGIAFHLVNMARKQMFIDQTEISQGICLSDLDALDTVCTEGAARVLGLSTSWLHKRRLTGSTDGPNFLKLGHKVFYRLGDLRAWQDAHLKGGA